MWIIEQNLDQLGMEHGVEVAKSWKVSNLAVGTWTVTRERGTVVAGRSRTRGCSVSGSNSFAAGCRAGSP